MKTAPAVRLVALTAGAALLAVVAGSATPEAADNLLACKKGWTACVLSRLSLTEKNEVARATHARNVWDCTNASPPATAPS
jgi:hypothetical protein